MGIASCFLFALDGLARDLFDIVVRHFFVFFLYWCPIAPFRVVQLNIEILELSFSDFNQEMGKSFKWSIFFKGKH